ncbi:MAG: hypothetical protein HKN47_22625 [Pirellulaceae bacterium]|nr:hypothetical protein [Pirellulaceae bacterium]
MDPHPYGWMSLLPPIIAIVLAIVTRRAVVSLLLGIFVGALVTTHGNLPLAIHDFFEVHLWPTLIDPGKLRVFAFTLLMGAMVGVISRGGGMQGLIHKISPFAKTRRGGQLTTWVLGWVIFFDDYANTILLGSTLRSLCDRLNISREKLAYMVDSTAAPIASVALLSTWIAVEIDYIEDGLGQVGHAGSVNAMSLFVASIPYRFYVVGALLFVPMVAILGREFGPMLRAEQECRRQGDRDTRRQVTSSQATLETEYAAIDPHRARWYNAAVPILITLAVVIWLLYITGRASLLADGVTDGAGLQDIIGAADSSLALQYGSLAGLIAAGMLCWTQRLLDMRQIMHAAAQGAQVVLPALVILWSASTLSRLTGSKSVEGQSPTVSFEYQDHRLSTGDYLAAMLLPSASGSADEGVASQSLTIKLLPTVIFVLAAVLSFATGTSFGTMGILMPMVVAFGCRYLIDQTGAIDPGDPLLLTSIASVLSGAVFGDHCSPISDTTVLSSQASACDHMAHVLTQIPYALLVGGVAILLGTLPIGWGVSVWLLLPLQVLALLTFLRLVGRKVDA